MTKLITGYLASLIIGTIHWIVELTPILEFVSLCMAIIGLIATAIIAWKRVFKKYN